MRNDRKIDAMVELSRRGRPGTVIRMEMTEYKEFIREQSETLGLVEQQEQKKRKSNILPRHYDGSKNIKRPKWIL